jgi:hypothetical protein
MVEDRYDATFGLLYSHIHTTPRHFAFQISLGEGGMWREDEESEWGRERSGGNNGGERGGGRGTQGERGRGGRERGRGRERGERVSEG